MKMNIKIECNWCGWSGEANNLIKLEVEGKIKKLCPECEEETYLRVMNS
jgi:predicted RNA-binding Zn-ribbon protein involved in translation (DUF1610 family)